MSDLSATNCGCGCETTGGGSNLIFLILILICCGGCGFGGGFCEHNGCGGGCSCGFGGGGCEWLIWIILLCLSLIHI